MSTPSTDPRELDAPPVHPEGGGIADPGVELSSRRTGLSFQRTRMSADRTLLSMLRTAIALVGFGFTIAQFFQRLHQSPQFAQLVGTHAARNFGLALVLLGNGLLAAALAQHVTFRRGLRAERALLVREGLVHGEEPFASSAASYVALLFLLLSLTVVLGMVFRAGPFN